MTTNGTITPRLNSQTASLDLEIAPARNAKNSSSSSLLLLLDGKAGDGLSKPKSVAFVAFVAGDGLTLLLVEYDDGLET